MEKSTKQHWFHLISLGFTWFPRQRASLGQVRWWSSGYRFPPTTAGRPVKIQFPASATLVVARMVQNIMDFTKPFPLQREESEDFTGIRVTALWERHLSIAGCSSFTGQGSQGSPCQVWSWLCGDEPWRSQFLISRPLRQISPSSYSREAKSADVLRDPSISIGSFGLLWTPRSKGEEALKILAEGPEQQVSGAWVHHHVS